MLMTSRCVILASCLSFKLKSQLPTVHIHLGLTHRYLTLNDVETEHIFLPGAAHSPRTCLWYHWTWNLRVILDIFSSSLSPESVSHERLMWIIKCWLILLSPWLVTSSLGHRDSLAPFQQFYWSLVPRLLFKSVFHTALGKKVYSKQKTINLLIVSIHLMHSLCPAC